MADTFIWQPSYGSSSSTKPDVSVTQFGDGYESRLPNGINSRRRKWHVIFENRPTATADSIEAFLDTQNATKSFLWTPPTGLAGKWVCREWNGQPTGPQTRTVSATFDEVFE